MILRQFLELWGVSFFKIISKCIYRRLFAMDAVDWIKKCVHSIFVFRFDSMTQKFDIICNNQELKGFWEPWLPPLAVCHSYCCCCNCHVGEWAKLTSRHVSLYPSCNILSHRPYLTSNRLTQPWGNTPCSLKTSVLDYLKGGILLCQLNVSNPF